MSLPIASHHKCINVSVERKAGWVWGLDLEGPGKLEEGHISFECPRGAIAGLYPHAVGLWLPDPLGS